MHCHPPELQLATTPWREHSEVSTVQYVLVLGLVVTARSVPHILLAWAISSLHWHVLTIFPLSTAHKVGHGSFGRIMRRIIYYSVFLQFTPNSVLTSGSVLLPNLSTRMQVFLGSTRARHGGSWTLEDVHEIEAFSRASM